MPTHGGMEQPECIRQLLNTGREWLQLLIGSTLFGPLSEHACQAAYINAGNPGLQGAAQPAWPTVRPADVRSGSTAQLATADLGNSNPAGANAEPVIPAATSRGLQTQLPEIPFQPQPKGEKHPQLQTGARTCFIGQSNRVCECFCGHGILVSSLTPFLATILGLCCHVEAEQSDWCAEVPAQRLYLAPATQPSLPGVLIMCLQSLA